MNKKNKLIESYGEFNKLTFGLEETESLLEKILGTFKPNNFYFYTANPNLGDGLIFFLGAAAFSSKYLKIKSYFISDYSTIFANTENLVMINRKDFSASRVQSNDMVFFDSKGFYQYAFSTNILKDKIPLLARELNESFISELNKRQCRFLGIGSAISAAWSPNNLFSFVSDPKSFFDSPYVVSDAQEEFNKFLPLNVSLPSILGDPEFHNVYVLSDLVWKTIFGLQYDRSFISADLLLEKRPALKRKEIILNFNTRADYKRLRIEDFFERLVDALVKIATQSNLNIQFVEPDQFQSQLFREKYENALSKYPGVVSRFTYVSESEKWSSIASSTLVLSICSGFNHLAVIVNPSMIGIAFRSWFPVNFNPWAPPETTTLMIGDEVENSSADSIEDAMRKSLEDTVKTF